MRATLDDRRENEMPQKITHKCVSAISVHSPWIRIFKTKESKEREENQLTTSMKYAYKFTSCCEHFIVDRVYGRALSLLCFTRSVCRSFMRGN